MEAQQISCFLSLKSYRALFIVLTDCSHYSKYLTCTVCLLLLLSTSKNKTSHSKTIFFYELIAATFPLGSKSLTKSFPKALGILNTLFLLLGVNVLSLTFQILTLTSTQPGKLSNQVIVAYQFTSHQH